MDFMNLASIQGAVVGDLELIRGNLLQEVKPLIEIGRTQEAVKRVQEATKLTEQLERKKEIREKAKSLDQSDATTLLKKLKDDRKRIADLEIERDVLLQRVDALIGQGKTEEAVKQVGFASEISQDLDRKSMDLTNQLELAKELTTNLGRERSRIESIRKQQELVFEKPSKEIPNFSRVVLNGISLGYQTPRKLSRQLNMDKNIIQTELDSLVSKGFAIDSSDPVIDFFEMLQLGKLVDFIEVFTTRKLTNGFVLTDTGYNELGDETLLTISARLEMRENIPERVVGGVLGLVISVARPILNYILAVAGLLGLVFTVVKEIPTIFKWVLELWVSGIFSEKS